MAITLLEVVNEILRATQQRCDKTAFSNNDDTNYIVDRVNDGLEDIYNLSPTEVDANGTVTIAASTRTVSGPAGLELNRIYDWSFRLNDSDGDIPMDVVTKEYIVNRFPLFETEEAETPQYVYIDNNTIAVYPLLAAGSSSLTLQFSYPANMTKLTTTTATFPFQDRSDELRYIKLNAQFEYEVFKGLGNPGVTQDKKDGLWARMVAKNAKLKRQGFIGYRVYGGQ
jgi:hypothetical protein